MSRSVNLRHLSTTILMLGVFALMLSGCFGSNRVSEPTYTVSGRITQADNPQRGIEDVTIAFSNGFGTAKTDSNGNWAKSGLKGTVTITPIKTGWTFQPPSRQVSSSAKEVNFVGTPAGTQYTLTVQISGQGSVTKDPDQSSYGNGAKVRLTANPSVGWAFSHWEGDLTGSNNPQTIVINGDKNVTAVFVKLQYNLNVTVPTGLTAVAGGNVDDVFIDLTWNPNTEPDLAGYKVWLLEDGIWFPIDTVDAYTTHYRHTLRTPGVTYMYSLSAFDKFGNESEKCAPVQCTAGDTVPPAAPEWDPVEPITTGGVSFGEYSCWIRLKWREVTKNADGTPITDLYAYRIYSVDDGRKFITARVPAGQTEYTIRELGRGYTYSFVVTALDKWGNESEDSTPQSITVGGLPPAAPVLISVEAVGDRAVKVTFQKVDKNVDSSPADDIKGYIVYRGINPSILVEIGRIDAESPQPDVYEFLDTTVVRGATYYYAVTAYDKDFNESEKSNVLSVRAGDFEAPSPPQWVSLTTQVDDNCTISNVLQWTTGRHTAVA